MTYQQNTKSKMQPTTSSCFTTERISARSRSPDKGAEPEDRYRDKEVERFTKILNTFLARKPITSADFWDIVDPLLGVYIAYRVCEAIKELKNKAITIKENKIVNSEGEAKVDNPVYIAYRQIIENRDIPEAANFCVKFTHLGGLAVNIRESLGKTSFDIYDIATANSFAWLAAKGTKTLHMHMLYQDDQSRFFEYYGGATDKKESEEVNTLLSQKLRGKKLAAELSWRRDVPLDEVRLVDQLCTSYTIAEQTSMDRVSSYYLQMGALPDHSLGVPVTDEEYNPDPASFFKYRSGSLSGANIAIGVLTLFNGINLSNFLTIKDGKLTMKGVFKEKGPEISQEDWIKILSEGFYMPESDRQREQYERYKELKYHARDLLNSAGVDHQGYLPSKTMLSTMIATGRITHLRPRTKPAMEAFTETVSDYTSEHVPSDDRVDMNELYLSGASAAAAIATFGIQMGKIDKIMQGNPEKYGAFVNGIKQTITNNFPTFSSYLQKLNQHMFKAAELYTGQRIATTVKRVQEGEINKFELGEDVFKVAKVANDTELMDKWEFTDRLNKAKNTLQHFATKKGVNIYSSEREKDMVMVRPTPFPSPLEVNMDHLNPKDNEMDA